MICNYWMNKKSLMKSCALNMPGETPSSNLVISVWIEDPMALARISRVMGLNVIMGSGYYIAVSHKPDMDAKTEEEITEEIVQDITEGIDDI